MTDRVPFSRTPAADPRSSELADWLELARRLAAAGHVVRRTLAGQEQFGETEQLVLWHCWLGPQEGLGQSELVAAVGCSPAQISGLVESLRQAGQLRARRSSRDRRRQLWSLTTAGHATLDEWQAEQAAALAELSRRLPAESLKQMTGLLARIEEETSAASPSRQEAA